MPPPVTGGGVPVIGQPTTFRMYALNAPLPSLSRETELRKSDDSVGCAAIGAPPRAKLGCTRNVLSPIIDGNGHDRVAAAYAGV